MTKDPNTLRLMAGHARYRAHGLRAASTVASAREDAARAAAAIQAAGGELVDTDLPEDFMDAANKLEGRANWLDLQANEIEAGR